MTILQIILVATHIFMILVGFQVGKDEGIKIGRSDMYKEMCDLLEDRIAAAKAKR